MSQSIEELRTAFADEVITRASKCRSNGELVQQLERDFHCELIGEGSTRRVYASPLGIVVKVQRGHLSEDPQEDDGGGDRGGVLGLSWSRRIANLAEFMFSLAFPKRMPQQYGFLASFGVTQAHPSVLVTETAKTLDLFLPGDGNGIPTENLGLDADGYLWVFDERLTPEKMPADLTPYMGDEAVLWLGNLGVVESGHYVYVDRSRNCKAETLLDTTTLSPKSWGSSPSNTPTQTLEFSKNLFLQYEEARIAAISPKG